MHRRPRPSAKALFRHHAVSEVRARLLAGKRLARAIAEVVALPHVDELGRPRTLFPRTLRRWVRAHAKAGLEALEDRPRPRIADSRALSPELLAFLREQKKSDESASLPELIRRARVLGVVSAGQAVDRTSAWRACRRMELPLTRRRRLAQADMRSFAYPNRMLMVLVDGKHFRAGVGRHRRVALAFIDDATRFGLDAWVGSSENSVLFLTGLREVVLRFGLMAALYLDRGPGFNSDDTHSACALLQVAFVHGRAGYPEGHGKIEKFNQTWKHQLLRSFDGHPEIDPDPTALRARLLHYMREVYNKTPHESLGGDTPEQRWNADPRPLSFPEDRDWLDGCFVVTFSRRVSKDNLVPFEGVDYELPQGHAGSEITVHRSLLRGTLWVLHEGRLGQIHPVDRVSNAYSRRVQRSAADTAPPAPIVHTAASLAYQRDFAPLVDTDGGYPKGDDEP